MAAHDIVRERVVAWLALAAIIALFADAIGSAVLVHKRIDRTPEWPDDVCRSSASQTLAQRAFVQGNQAQASADLITQAAASGPGPPE
jgi:hypothetical protein